MDIIRNLFWNREEARLRAGWRLIMAIFVWFVLLFLVLGLHDGMLSETLPDLYRDWVTLVIHLLLVGLVFMGLVGSRLLDRRPVADYGFHLSKAWWLDVGFGVALAAFLLLGIFFVELALGWIEITGIFVSAAASQPYGGYPFGLVILLGFIGFLCGAMQEEITWRGYLTQNLAEGLNWKRIGPARATLLAMLVWSVLFGWGHGNIPHATILTPYNTILATVLVLAAGYVLTGELALSIGFHTAWNFAQVFVLGFPGGDPMLGTSVFAFSQHGPELWTGGAYGPEGGLLGTIAFLLAFVPLALWVRWHYGSIRLHPSIAQPPARRPGIESLQSNQQPAVIPLDQ
jgi:uncharacterized protein